MGKACSVHCHHCNIKLQHWMQAAGYALRISCATPVLSSALGMAGIGFSSILAGEASRRFGARLRGAQQHRSMQVLARDMALDAVLGMSLYKVRLQSMLACHKNT